MHSRASKKHRADELLVRQGLAETRSKAAAMILAGEVYVRKTPESSRETVSKAGQAFTEEACFEVESLLSKDVGRGAQKLRAAFEHWSELSVQGRCCLDIGASTGGFTQVMLEHGAERVVAMDVGHGQLHERLKKDPRVIEMERHHVLRVEAADWARIGQVPPFDFIATDVSFISLTRLVPRVAEWLKAGASWVCLVKPQFEVGPKKAPGGIVRNSAYHEEAIELVRAEVRLQNSLEWKSLIESPLLGGDGNKEFLAWVQKKE